MDNDALNEIVENTGQRQFWIVLWGDPTHSANEDAQVFNEPFYDHGFPRDVPEIRVGDILLVHRIKISKIMFIGEIVERARISTAAESQEDWWRKRWKWSVRLKNLTPTYGSSWRDVGSKTFALNKEYNEQNPKAHVSIGALQHGRHVKINQGFASFLLKAIMEMH